MTPEELLQAVKEIAEALRSDMSAQVEKLDKKRFAAWSKSG